MVPNRSAVELVRRNCTLLIATVCLFLTPAAAQQGGNLFLPATAYSSAGAFATDVAVADLNHDGMPDLVVSNGYNGSVGEPSGVAVLMAQGNGTFKSAVTYKTGGRGAFANSVAIADVNGDGKLDLVVADSCEDSYCHAGSFVAVLLGNGNGTFHKLAKYRSAGSTYEAKVADVNRDGIPDLVVLNFCTGSFKYAHCTAGPTLTILLGLGNGKFQPAVSYPVNEAGSYSFALGDLNGDGILDAVVTSFCSTPTCAEQRGTIGVFIGNGDGTFQPVVSYYTGGGASAVAIADVNGDGKLDVAVANGGSDTVSVFLGNGNGSFQSPVLYGIFGDAPSITIADVNNDGTPDLIVGSGDFAVIAGASILLGNGDGTFQSPTVYSSLEYGATSVAVADVNGDGRPDVIVTNDCDSASCASGWDGSVAVLLHAVTPDRFQLRQ